MKRFLKVLFVFSLAAGLAAGCAKEYDDTELKGKVESLSAEVNTLKANQQAMQAVIEAWKKGGYIASIDNSVPGQHTITFYGTEGKTVIIYDGVDGEDGEDGKDGKDGDSCFKSVVPGEDGVTFTLKDDTSFTIPFAKAFKLVIENTSAEIEAGKPVEFPYTIQNANSTTTVEVFAGNNYEAVVNETDKKIVVTPPTPAVNGSVLVWAQNEEGLMSMRKLSFIVKAEVEIEAEDIEELQAIPADAADVEVPIVSNIPVDVVQPNVDWVTAEIAKANYKLVLSFQENTTGEPRETAIKIVRADNGSQVQEIKIVQTATKAEPAEPTPFDSNVTWTLGNKAYDSTVSNYLGSLDVTYNETVYKNIKHLKLGTASVAGDATLKLPKGTKYISFWGVAWNDKDCDIKVEALGKTFTVKKHDGVKGAKDDKTPYTMTPTVTDEDKFEIVLDAALEADAEVKIQTSANPGYRLVLFGIQASETVPEPPIAKLKMSDVQALCKSSSNAEFYGEFEGLYINYILGTQHIYLEDESGAIRYYAVNGKTVKVGGEDYTLKVGDKISGVLSGTCNLDGGTRPTINYLDFKNAKVEAAPAEEQPKPVTGTLGSFTDVQGLMYRRVTLEKVVLDANLLKDKSSQKITISDGTGSIQLHLRFDPKQNIPQGYRVSGTGTFDVDNGKLEIRVFSLADVTEVLPPPALTVERLWGKYSNSTAAWNAYYGGTANSDRNLAMDDDYIFVQESTAAAKIWKIPVDGTSAPGSVNVEGVSGGTHAVSCIRMVPNTAAGVNGGKDFLMGVSLTIDDSATPMKVYSWGNGVDSKPTATSASTYCNRRLGDKFTVYGSLQDGALFFKDYNNASDQGAFMVLRMAWSEVPGDGFFNPRRTNMFVEGGMGAYYPLPGNASKGLYTSTASAKFAQFTDSPLSVSPNTSGAFADAGGYYVDAHGFNCFEFNGKRYIAYVKNAGSGDGRFYVLEGDSTTDWADMLGSKRKVIYQACIQEDLAYTDGEYHADMAANPSPKTSGNSGIDCAIRVKSDGVYFAVMKQHVGLSLFKMSMK